MKRRLWFLGFLITLIAILAVSYSSLASQNSAAIHPNKAFKFTSSSPYFYKVIYTTHPQKPSTHYTNKLLFSLKTRNNKFAVSFDKNGHFFILRHPNRWSTFWNITKSSMLIRRFQYFQPVKMYGPGMTNPNHIIWAGGNLISSTPNMDSPTLP